VTVINLLKSNSFCSLIVGKGKVARLFSSFFERQKIAHTQWSRSQGLAALEEKSSTCTHVLLCLPDKVLTPFVDEHWDFFKNKTLIHFSATHTDARLLGFHPLGAFTLEGSTLLEEVFFHGPHPESIFREALPVLKNPYKELSAGDMQKYHALCVLGGNYTSLLWKIFFSEIQKLGISPEAAISYIQMNSQNVLQNPQSSLTGPLLRGDTPTLEKNIHALSTNPELAEIYSAFVKTFQKSEYLK
jgi:hypothetical protein